LAFYFDVVRERVKKKRRFLISYFLTPCSVQPVARELRAWRAWSKQTLRCTVQQVATGSFLTVICSQSITIISSHWALSHSYNNVLN